RPRRHWAALAQRLQDHELVRCHRLIIFCAASEYRAPFASILAAPLSISRRSSALISTLTAETFSLSRWSFVVPGIGTIQDFCASSQASATWAGVAFFCSAMRPSNSINAWLAFRFSAEKRGTVLR